jgi:hypothetical protein
VVISRKHKYVYVEMAHTASTAIGRELCEHYGGELILARGSTYRDFLKVATEEEKGYFVFSCLRNPLDIAVTKYFKYKTDHRNRRTDPVKVARRRGIGGAIDMRIFRFVRENQADFGTFFMKLYRMPYNSSACLDHRDFDYLMRFESLAADFAQVLKRIGVEQVRPLPRNNITAERERDFLTYYDSPRVVARAKRVFAIYMNEWGYEFPPEWGQAVISRRDRIAFDVWSFIFKLYWRHLKPWVWRIEMRDPSRGRTAGARARVA